MIKSGFAIAVALIAFAYVPASSQTQDQGLEAFEGLLRAVKERDYERLADFVSDKARFFDGEALRPAIEDFVYGGEGAFVSSKGFRSLSEIASQASYVVATETQGDGSVIFHFIPGDYLEDSKTKAFYEEQWMRKYFACQFWKVDGAWKMVSSFCFAETGGPYQGPYG